MPSPVKYGTDGKAIARLSMVPLLTVARAPTVPIGVVDSAHKIVVRQMRRSGVDLTTAKSLVRMIQASDTDPQRRADYLLNAGHRVSQAVSNGTDRGVALDTERRYMNAHVKADRARKVAAGIMRAHVGVYGDLLGWYSVMDDRTTPECVAMNGKNFSVQDPPAAGLPGVTHVGCRCVAGPPHKEGTVEMSVDFKTLELAADSMLKASTPEPTGTKDLWGMKGAHLPYYVQHIVNALKKKRGMDESKAVAIAIGTIKRWAMGGGKVDKGTQAAATKALGEWEATKARAHALSHVTNGSLNTAVSSRRDTEVQMNRLLELTALTPEQMARAKKNAAARGTKPGAYDYLRAAGKKMKATTSASTSTSTPVASSTDGPRTTKGDMGKRMGVMHPKMLAARKALIARKKGKKVSGTTEMSVNSDVTYLERRAIELGMGASIRAAFNEALHHRASNGKFDTGAGPNAGSSDTKAVRASTKVAKGAMPKKVAGVGNTMGKVSTMSPAKRARVANRMAKSIPHDSLGATPKAGLVNSSDAKLKKNIADHKDQLAHNDERGFGPWGAAFHTAEIKNNQAHLDARKAGKAMFDGIRYSRVADKGAAESRARGAGTRSRPSPVASASRVKPSAKKG